MIGKPLARERAERLANAMKEQDLELLIVYGNAWLNDYLRYATDFGILEGQGLALVTADGDVTLYLDLPQECDRAALETQDVKIVYAPKLIDAFLGAVERGGNRRIGAAPLRALPNAIARRSPNLRIGDATSFFDGLLMRKLKSEVEAVRSAAYLADEGYDVFLQAARAGRHDYELIAEVEAFYRSKGVDDNFMIIGVGGREVRGMAPPAGKVLSKGDLVTTELTPCIDGYYVQICRTLVVGEPTDEQKTAFNVFNDALEAGIAAVKHGALASDVAKAENDVFRRHDLGAYVTDEYTRVRGHGLGLFVDTKPQLLENVHTPLEAGMVIIVHPNTYHPGAGYMVHGDALIVTETGADVLTRTPRQLFSVAA